MQVAPIGQSSQQCTSCIAFPDSSELKQAFAHHHSLFLLPFIFLSELTDGRGITPDRSRHFGALHVLRNISKWPLRPLPKVLHGRRPDLRLQSEEKMRRRRSAKVGYFGRFIVNSCAQKSFPTPAVVCGVMCGPAMPVQHKWQRGENSWKHKKTMGRAKKPIDYRLANYAK